MLLKLYTCLQIAFIYIFYEHEETSLIKKKTKNKITPLIISRLFL